MKLTVPVVTATLLLACTRPLLATLPQGPKEARDYVNRVIAKLSNQDPNVRAEAAATLATIAVDLHSSVLYLTSRAEHDHDPTVRRMALEAITRMGPSAKDAVRVLLKLLDDPNEEVKEAAIAAITATRPFSKAAIPKLMPLTQSKNLAIRRRAIASLGGFGEDSTAAIPLLIAALDDPDEGIPKKQPPLKFYAMNALRNINPDAEVVASILLKIQELGEIKVRGLGLEDLANVRPKDRKQLPILSQVLNNKEHPQLRWRAAYALGAAGDAAKDAVPDLLQAFSSKDVPDPQLASRIKLSILWALGQIGPSAQKAIPLLERIATGEDLVLRPDAERALKVIRRKP